MSFRNRALLYSLVGFILFLSFGLNPQESHAQGLGICLTNPFGLTQEQRESYAEGQGYIAALAAHSDLFNSITASDGSALFELNEDRANWLKDQTHCLLYYVTPQEISANLGVNSTAQVLADTMIALGENLRAEPTDTVEALEHAEHFYDLVSGVFEIVEWVYTGFHFEIHPYKFFFDLFARSIWNIGYDLGLAGNVLDMANEINDYLTAPFTTAVGISTLPSSPASSLDGGICQYSYGTSLPMYQVALIGNTGISVPDPTALGYFNLFQRGSTVSFVLGLQNMQPFFSLLGGHTDYVIVLIEYTDAEARPRIERILLPNTITPGLDICTVGRAELPDIRLGSEIHVRYLFIENGHLDTSFDPDGVQNPLPAPDSLCYGACGVYNYPPHSPANPAPANGSSNLGTGVSLNWIGSDPDGDDLTYDVYLESGDTTPDILFVADQPTTSFDPGVLLADTRYFWQVVARDEHGLTTSGPVWYFDTGSVAPVTMTEAFSFARGGGFFGFSVDASSEWDRIAVGADMQGDGGTAYVMKWDYGVLWQQEAPLVGSDTAFSHHFGASVDMVGDQLVVGAPGDNLGGGGPGRAHIFAWDGATWTEQVKLTASDGATPDQFGHSVSMNDPQDVVAIGAPFDDNGVSNSGSVYLFAWNGATWVQYGPVQAGDPTADDHFGWSVDLDAAGNRLVVASHSAAYVFEKQGLDWVQVAKLSGDTDASIAGSTIIAGAEIYRYNGASWIHQTTLVPSDGQPNDYFGNSVAINTTGNVVVVGADGSNSAYLFRLC